jgi:hypothetical protein
MSNQWELIQPQPGDGPTLADAIKNLAGDPMEAAAAALVVVGNALRQTHSPDLDEVVAHFHPFVKKTLGR